MQLELLHGCVRQLTADSSTSQIRWTVAYLQHGVVLLPDSDHRGVWMDETDQALSNIESYTCSNEQAWRELGHVVALISSLLHSYT
jgi:hypothetical protein